MPSSDGGEESAQAIKEHEDLLPAPPLPSDEHARLVLRLGQEKPRL